MPSERVSGTDDMRRLVGLLDRVDGLLTSLSEAERSWAEWWSTVAPEHRSSARNLVHYWAIRQSDLRELQTDLAEFGLSSLGRSESHVQATLSAVRSAISAIVEGRWEPPPPSVVPIGRGPEILRQHTVELLGPRTRSASVAASDGNVTMMRVARCGAA